MEVTKEDLDMVEIRLSRQITKELTEACWKIIPISISIQLAMSSLIAACMFLVARAIGN